MKQPTFVVENIALLFFSLPLICFSAWTGWLLWGWFLVPIGVVSVTFGQFFGLRWLWFYLISSCVRIEEITIELLLREFFLTLLLLGVGYIIHILI